MTALFKSSFTWQFVSGFLLGAIGIFTLQPGANAAPSAPIAHTVAR